MKPVLSLFVAWALALSITAAPAATLKWQHLLGYERAAFRLQSARR